MSEYKTVNDEWIPLQKTVFTRWFNFQLNGYTNGTVEDITKDLSNGVLLVQLAIILTKNQTPRSIFARPKRSHENITNNDFAIEMFKNDGVKLADISGKSISGNDEKVILNLIWTLISHYTIRLAASTSSCSSKENHVKSNAFSKNSKDIILDWANDRIANYPHIQNFTPYSLMLCALLDSYLPNKINYLALKPFCEIENAKLAEMVMDELNIPVLIKPDEIKKIDKKVPDFPKTTAEFRALLTQLSIAKIVFDNYQNQTKDNIKCKTCKNLLLIYKNKEHEIIQPITNKSKIAPKFRKKSSSRHCYKQQDIKIQHHQTEIQNQAIQNSSKITENYKYKRTNLDFNLNEYQNQPDETKNHEKTINKFPKICNTQSNIDKVIKPQIPPEETIKILYDNTKSGEFHGIIYYLTKKCGGNVHKEKIVDVTSSSVLTNQPSLPLFLHFDNDEEYYNPYNCVDLDDEMSCFESEDEPNSWICYDFQNLKVKANKYSIRTYMNGFNHMMNWSIESSNDKNNWTILDNQKNQTIFNSDCKSKVFTLTNNDNFYRYFRLRQTGPTKSGMNILNISALEFFGTLNGRIIKSPRIQQLALHHQHEESNDDDFIYHQLNFIPDHPYEINYDDTKSGRFKGIIRYLSEKCGGNVHKKGAVKVTSSSVFQSMSSISFIGNDNDYNPYNCVDLENKKSCFMSDEQTNSWICYDFRNLKVCPNKYSIRSYLNGDNHLQEWFIEGSNDRQYWKIIDERRNETSLNDTGKSNTFSINRKEKQFYRFLRLKQTGRNTKGSKMICLSALEFFGSIVLCEKEFKKSNVCEKKPNEIPQKDLKSAPRWHHSLF